MAINKAMRAALAVLSYSEADIKKSYQRERLRGGRRNRRFIGYGSIR